MNRFRRKLSLLLALCLLFCAVAPIALAATTTITNEDIPYDFFQYYSSGSWHDLNTPVHRDASGNFAYCIDHMKDPPSSSAQYTDFDPVLVFNATTIKGIQAILDHGYPVSTGGLSSSKAHYATANAIRTWIKDSTGVGYNFMASGSSNIRAKSDSSDCWAFYQQLVSYAYAGATTGGGSGGQVIVSSQNLKWQLQGGQLYTTLTVQASDGYTITPSTGQINILGYTGGTYDVLTITAPLSLMGTDVSLFIQGKGGGGGTSALLYWYEPGSSSIQRVVVTKLTSGGIPDSGYVYITGEFHDLTVKKTDGYTGTALDGATFQLLFGGSPVGLTQTGAGQYLAGGSLTTFTTSGGTAVITGLPAGDYQLVEVSTPNAAYTASPAVNIRLYANGLTTVPNNPTKIVVEKKDGLTGEVMPNVTFTLTDQSGNPVKLSKAQDGTYRPDSSGSNAFIVDSAGKATIMYLPKGKYTIDEPGMEGYAELGPETFDLAGVTTIEATNEPTTLKLTKVDSFTGKTMPGIPFELYDSSGDSVKLTKQSDGVYLYDANGTDGFTTGADGTATIYYIPAGTYTVRETTTAAMGYTTPRDVTVTVTRQHRPSNPATVRFNNEPTALEFIKSDALTKEALDGATFQLKDGAGNVVKLAKIDVGSYKPDTEGSDTFTTSKGKAVIRYLLPGQYTLTELSAPNGYAKDTDKVVAVSKYNGASNPARASMQDRPLALELIKTDEMTGEPLDGCTFTIMDSEGDEIKLRKISDGVYNPDKDGTSTFTTYQGKATIGPIAPGTYTVSESTAAPGYAKGADATVTVTESNDSDSPAKTAIANAPLAITIHKIDSDTKKPFGGTRFRLLDDDGHAMPVAPIHEKAGWYQFDTDGDEGFIMPSSGSLTVTGLPKGTYQLEETQEVDGYKRLTETVPVEVGEDYTYRNPAEFTVENEPLIVEVTKIDGFCGKPLPNVSFSITDAEGNVLKFVKVSDGQYRIGKDGLTLFETGSEGKAVIQLIPEGEYVLHEVEHPGFGSVEPVAFTVSQENTAETPVGVGVENYPLCVEITKVDKLDKSPLAEVPFKLLDAEKRPLRFAKQEDGSHHVGPDGEEVFLMNKDGRALLRYVPAGIYTLEEQPYDDYGTHEPVSIEITVENEPENPLKIKLENIPLAVELFKTDGNTGKPMQGVSFKLLDTNGKHIPLALMSNGAYRPLEKAMKDEQRNADASVTEAIIIKETVDMFITDKDGKARIEYLSPSKYQLEEQAVLGYVPLKGMSFVMTNANTFTNPLKYEVMNTPTRLLLEKQNGYNNEPLPGAKFRLTDSNGKAVKLFTMGDGNLRPAVEEESSVEVFTLDKNAQIAIMYLPAGKYTITETEAPAGYGIAAPVKAEVGTEAMLQIAREANTDSNGSLAAETSVAVLDMPLALKLFKIHGKTQKPLNGAAFALKASGSLSTPLRFTKKDSAYWYDPQGSVTAIETDKNAEALLLGLPVGNYVLEETVVPEHFFAVPPINIEITVESTSFAPKEVYVTNTPTVKLGIDSDKFNLVIGISATSLALLLFGGMYFLKKRKAK